MENFSLKEVLLLTSLFFLCFSPFSFPPSSKEVNSPFLVPYFIPLGEAEPLELQILPSLGKARAQKISRCPHQYKKLFRLPWYGVFRPSSLSHEREKP